ncbi:MAG: hypothetical protein CL678_15845 [Bdellovibrionaceae bacterium]|nr:hypothetical protein [Pseudobdellovibrionaceae bacterium]
MLDIWTWLGANREMSCMSALQPKNFSKVNLIWVESGEWFVINLGLLNSWANGDVSLESIADVDPERITLSLESDEGDLLIQRYFLRMLTSLYEVRTNTVSSTSPIEETVVAEVSDELGIPEDEVKKADDINVVESKEPRKIEPKDIVPGMSRSQEIREEKIRGAAKVQSAVGEKSETAAKQPQPEDLRLLDQELSSPKKEVIEDAAQTENPLVKGIRVRAAKMVEDGMMSNAQYNRALAMAEKYKEIPNPFGEGTLAEYIEPKEGEIELEGDGALADISTVTDKSMLHNTLEEVSEGYRKKLLTKDIAACVMNVQKVGVAVTKFEVEPIQDALNDFNAYTVRLNPVSGSPSTIRAAIYDIKEDGTYIANGVKCRLRWQRGDMPVRKISPDSVALTSFYGKVFVRRSAKKVNAYGTWLCDNIVALANVEESAVSDIHVGRVWKHQDKVPRLLSMLAQRIRSVKIGNVSFNFDYTNRRDVFGEDSVSVESNGSVLVGKTRNGLVVITADNRLMLHSGDKVTELPALPIMAGFENPTGPLEVAEINIFRSKIPVGVVLGYRMGLSNLLAKLNIVPRRVPKGTRLNLEMNEFAVQFIDESLVFDRNNPMAMLMMSGFVNFKNVIRNYGSSVFDKQDVYFNLLDSQGMGIRHLREIDLMFPMFIDPITEGILRSRDEPTEMDDLVIYAMELLTTDWHPKEIDIRYMRLKGYERFAGAFYQELIKSLRAYNARSMSAGASIEMSPHAVRQAIDQDTSKILVEESNPVHNTKEKEALTFSGTGGRSIQTMVKRTREFDPHDQGIVSEATVDNKSVGATTYLSANPQIANLRGVVKVEDKAINPTTVFSTSALLSVGVDHDDPKRINFVNIQQSSVIPADGYQVSPVRTGYEQVLAQRTDDLFATAAKQDGEVTSVTADGIVVTYADGSVRRIELGRRFGTVAGATVPHTVITDLKEGDKVVKGDILAFNTGYFARDPINPKTVAWKAGILVTTAFLESPDTLEDSCAISEKVAEQMTTQTTKIKNVVVKFDQVIHNLVKPGVKLDLSSILCTIEDPVTANSDLFDEDSLDTLRMLSAQTPRAKFVGTVERIEIYYNGDKEDMSESLRELSVKSDTQIRKRYKVQGRGNNVTGRVDSSMRVDGNPLESDTAVIKVYITASVPAGVGDKGVFGNQMKTVIGRVMTGINRTESGVDLGAIFGWNSVTARIVESPVIIGTTNTVLKLGSRRAVDIYRGKQQ